MKNTKISIDLGIPGTITVTFIILKLCKIINWSWWWVLSPIWIPLAIVVICIIILALVGDD